MSTFQGFESFMAKMDRLARINVSVATREGAEIVKDEAQAIAPVDTGELRDSIHVEEDGDNASVVADAPHAVFVEYGTYKMSAQPFMAPAAHNTKGAVAQAEAEKVRQEIIKAVA